MQGAAIQCVLGGRRPPGRDGGEVSASPVVIGEPVAPALAGYATRGDGDGAPVFDPIVHDAGPHIVWEQ